jgi:hypothetical protein
MLRLFSSFVVLTRLGQKMMTNAMFVVIFSSSYETRAENNDKHTLSLSFFFFALPKIVTSLPTPCRLLQLKKKTKKTQKIRRG